jgi:hypothetical protein
MKMKKKGKVGRLLKNQLIYIKFNNNNIFLVPKSMLLCAKKINKTKIAKSMKREILKMINFLNFKILQNL